MEQISFWMVFVNDLVKFLKEITKLKKVKRSGWVRVGIKNSESVADHSWSLAFLCMIFADKFELDAAKLIKMALIDDIAEIKTGDIVRERGNKTLIKRSDKIKIERKAINNIFANLENGQEYIDLWEEAQKMETKEAKFLKQLDKFEMAIQASEYANGVPHKKIEEFFTSAGNNISDPFLIKLVQELEK